MIVEAGTAGSMGVYRAMKVVGEVSQLRPAACWFVFARCAWVGWGLVSDMTLAFLSLFGDALH